MPKNTDPERLLTMQAGDFALVNPKTGTAPIFLTSAMPTSCWISTAIIRSLDAENRMLATIQLSFVMCAKAT